MNVATARTPGGAANREKPERKHGGRTCMRVEADLAAAQAIITRQQLQIADLTARIECAEEYQRRTLQILGNRA